MMRVDAEGVPTVVQQIYWMNKRTFIRMFDGSTLCIPYVPDLTIDELECEATSAWFRKIQPRKYNDLDFT